MLKFYFKQIDWAQEVHVYLVNEDAHGKHELAQPMELKFKAAEPCSPQEPTLIFRGMQGLNFLPALADGLARAGYKAQTGEVAELDAVKKHLDDMRTLAFKWADKKLGANW